MKSKVIIVSIAVFAGLVNGLLGIGGGTIVIPAMVCLLNLSQHQAHGTSLAIMLPTALISTVIYYLNSSIELGLVLKVVGSNMVGGYIGARLMPRIPSVQLRKLFGLFMLIAGIRMVL